MSRSVTSTQQPRSYSRTPVFALITLVLLNGAIARAEPTGAADTRQSGHGEVVASSDDTETDEKPIAKSAGGEGVGKQVDTRPPGTGDKLFNPTEKISEDFSVPFPVDI